LLCQGLTREQSNALYLEVLESGDSAALRKLCTEDLFFLLTIGCKRKDIDREWLYERCREVEADPDGHLDLWFREGYKSTLITFGLTIKDIFTDPNKTHGIFSHTRPIAKAFLKQIKREFEQNTFLKRLFPDILYDKPESESKQWSLDNGIVVKRQNNPKEATVEAWGLVDGQPTSKHFDTLIYDDVVTRESVSTPDQIQKTTEAWEMSLNLGAQGGRRRYIGTRYHLFDTYDTMLKRGSVKPRIKPATHNGEIDGDPVLWTKEALMEKRRDMGPYTFSCQLLQNPVADKAMSFKKEWLKYYETLGDYSKWNKFLLVDPANAKKKSSDYTVIALIGLAPDNNYYLIDAIRDRLNLTQRADKFFEFQRKYSPQNVGYERYGMQSDIEHIKYRMEQENFRFNITEVAGAVAKEDRIKQLIPIFEQGRFYLPKRLSFVDYESNTRDFVQLLIDDEFLAFPVCVHDDMLDCIARILSPELAAQFPKLQPTKPKPRVGYSGAQGWMS
jgi:predicted phage terminase large subunit-like protein